MIKDLFAYLIRILKDERGEVGDDINAGDDDHSDDLIDDDDPNVFSVDDDDSPGDDDEPEKKKEPAVDTAELSKKVSNLETQLTETKAALDERQRHISSLNKALHQERQSKKSKATDDMDAEPEFSDAQILRMMDEHEDDNAVKLQILKHVAKSAAKGAKKEAIDATETANTKRELDGYLSKVYPEINNEDSEFNTGIKTMKDKLGLSDHPYGNYFAVGSMLLGNIETILKNAREEGRQEILKGKTEENRKKSIKDGSPADRGNGKPKPSDLSPKVNKNIKMFGFNKKQAELYKKLVGSGQGAEV